MAQYQIVHDTETISTDQHKSIDAADSDATETKPGPYQSLLDSELTLTNSQEAFSSRQHFTRWQGIGLLGLITLILWTYFILASCAVLIYLWRGTELARDQKEHELWRTIVLSSWASRVATICSAVIRTSIAFQAGLVAAALSAIVLETSGVRFNDVPILSSPRMTHGQIITSKEPARVDYLNNGASHWRSKPSAHWRFAEFQADLPRYGDTGDTYRAMIPFSNTTLRTSLKTYWGPAIVIRPRASCLAPDLNNASINVSNMTIETRLGSERGSTKRTGRSAMNLVLGKDNECQMHVAGDRTGWPISLCFNLDEFMHVPSNLTETEAYNFRAILVLNSTDRVDDDLSYDSDGSLDLPKRLKTLTFDSSSDDIWTNVYDDNGDHALSASLCFFNWAPVQLYNITMFGRDILSEPSLDPDKVDDVRLQLDAKHNSERPTKRGILRLDVGPFLNVSSRLKDLLKGGELGYVNIDGDLKNILNELPVGSTTAWSMAVPDKNSSEINWSANRAHASLFQNIIQEDGDPAPAIQGLMTRLYQMAYYDQLDGYDLKLPVTTVHTTDQLVPVQWTGLTIVLVLVAAHLVIVYTTILLFVLETRASALGDSWHVLAQAARMAVAVEGADMMLDKEFKKWTKATGKHKDFYGVTKSVEVGKVEVQLLKQGKKDGGSHVTDSDQ
ncbi:hypothetical protein IL306_002240 [Fusarium sp. DS 682]|nr:hypothetical protein IL306_002240 [Fusarium sp. DS 682]